MAIRVRVRPCSEREARLIRYHFTKSASHVGDYHSLWAEPDVDEAGVVAEVGVALDVVVIIPDELARDGGEEGQEREGEEGEGGEEERRPRGGGGWGVFAALGHWWGV